jgi:methyl-accepting chemotaxis protein
MSTALGLAMQISANTAQLGTAVQDINKRLDQMADSGKKAANDLGVLKNLEIAKAFIAGITAVATGLVRAASGAKDLFDSSRAAIDEIGKLSARTGIAVETIQQLQLVATESGSSTDALAKAFGQARCRDW